MERKPQLDGNRCTVGERAREMLAPPAESRCDGLEFSSLGGFAACVRALTASSMDVGFQQVMLERCMAVVELSAAGVASSSATSAASESFSGVGSVVSDDVHPGSSVSSGGRRRRRGARGKRSAVSSVVSFTGSAQEERRGGCYLQLVQDCCRAQVYEELGDEPTFRQLLELPGEKFIEKGKMSDLRISRVDNGIFHLGSTGVPVLQALKAISVRGGCKLNERLLFEGSLDEALINRAPLLDDRLGKHPVSLKNFRRVLGGELSASVISRGSGNVTGTMFGFDRVSTMSGLFLLCPPGKSVHADGWYACGRQSWLLVLMQKFSSLFVPSDGSVEIIEARGTALRLWCESSYRRGLSTIDRFLMGLQEVALLSGGEPSDDTSSWDMRVNTKSYTSHEDDIQDREYRGCGYYDVKAQAVSSASPEQVMNSATFSSTFYNPIRIERMAFNGTVSGVVYGGVLTVGDLSTKIALGVGRFPNSIRVRGEVGVECVVQAMVLEDDYVFDDGGPSDDGFGSFQFLHMHNFPLLD